MLEYLGKLPTESGALWLWADFIELHCLNSTDKEITVSDIHSIIRKVKDFNSDSDEEYEGSTKASVNDRQLANVRDRFEFLAIRSELFGHHYPFVLNQENNELSLKTDISVDTIKPYILLLLSSGLRYHDPLHHNALTKNFECLSTSALKNVLGGNAEVYLFSSQNGTLPNTAILKIRWLADQLSTSVDDEAEEILGRNIAGECGLDIVAWFKTGDPLFNRLLFFAQCACSPDWPKKVHESSPTRWNKILKLDQLPANLMFTPHSYRRNGNKWVKNYELDDAVLFDRRRILEYLVDTQPLSTEPLINDTLDQLTQMQSTQS